MGKEKNTPRIHLANYALGGFHMTKRVSRADFRASPLLPDRLLSASGCISGFAPDTWALDWGEEDEDVRRQAAAEWGVEGESLLEAMIYASERFDKDFLWPNFMRNLNFAQEFKTQFMRPDNDLSLFALALGWPYVDRVMTMFRRRPNPDAYTEGWTLYRLLEQRLALPDGGHPLGFEPLCWDWSFYDGLGCSWVCNGLHTNIDAVLRIRPNAHGLLDTEDDADRAVEYIAQPEVGAEPGLWLPWLLVEYSLSP